MLMCMHKDRHTHMPSLTPRSTSGTPPLTPLNKAQEFMTRAFHNTGTRQVQEEGVCVRDNLIIIKHA